MEESGGGGSSPVTPAVPPSSSRWNPTKEQISLLEGLYREGMRTPSAEQIQQITGKLRKHGRIEGKNVFYWFQNHKARQRQKQKQGSRGYFAGLLHRAGQPRLCPAPQPPALRPPLPSAGAANAVISAPIFMRPQYSAGIVAYPPPAPGQFQVRLQLGGSPVTEWTVHGGPGGRSNPYKPKCCDVDLAGAPAAAVCTDDPTTPGTLQLFPLRPTGFPEDGCGSPPRRVPSEPGGPDEEQRGGEKPPPIDFFGSGGRSF